MPRFNIISHLGLPLATNVVADNAEAAVNDARRASHACLMREYESYLDVARLMRVWGTARAVEMSSTPDHCESDT